MSETEQPKRVEMTLDQVREMMMRLGAINTAQDNIINEVIRVVAPDNIKPYDAAGVARRVRSVIIERLQALQNVLQKPLPPIELVIIDKEPDMQDRFEVTGDAVPAADPVSKPQEPKSEDRPQDAPPPKE